ncbi:telomere-associated protein Tap [Streptomyces turgidiscabies]|uniref:DNA-binding helix-turn-helix protein n=1 Tax=Streptomyces turgidiscabies (strain Car8) TaxID=698760 RepID=L7FFN8_STRT8|nr:MULTISPECIES: helix-turn-helix transcriptional regulator [Streptomyces]ELP70208.1 DNA-binding helix-turn-helix protein [Streptomyces turgidiscabies Car8]MDX3496657.1 helix-turn-helix transcriptional regulator [Streptomyces turgidiscabies]GAQ72858.1 putative transcriptional regulator [Streptomyces turgidiscabies]
MSELFDRIDALVASRSSLPPPAERKRLRNAHGLTLDEVADALGVRRATVSGWESGKTEPRPPERDAYARLLKQLAELYPADADTVGPLQGTAVAATATSVPAPAPKAPPVSSDPAPVSLAPAPEAADTSTGYGTPPRPATAPAAVARPASASGASTSRRPGSRTPAKTAASAVAEVDPRFANGPLAVVDCEDGQVSAYCVGGLVLDVPAKSLPALVDWTLAGARLGQTRLHRHGRDADPVLVLTPSALERYGLPVALSDDERRAGRLNDSHKVVRQIKKAELQLTQRGFGPWARVFRDPEGSKRRCVQLCIPSWNALDVREWDNKDDPQLPTMHPADLARYLGTYAQLVTTPRGTTSTTGLELMTALRPPTRAERDEATGTFKPAFNADALTAVYEHVECEVPDEHPILQGKFERHHLRTPDQMLMEEPFDWCRPLTDEECMKPYLVVIDVNLAFAAAANGLTVGLDGPTHLSNRPAFDPKLPGSWLVDLSHADLSRVKVNGRTVDAERLPSPFTPKGDRPTGPAWYATPTVAYAQELGFEVAPIEAYVRPQSGRYLDPWYNRLRDAYVTVMAELGVTTSMGGSEFLEAMARSTQVDPTMALLLKAIKATAKGGIGKLRQRNRGQVPYYEPWPALKRETWRPDIRAAVLANVRVGMHRKLMKTAAAADLYPVAIGTDAIVYPSAGPSPLDVLPYTDEGKAVPGTFRLGVSPGMVKHQGTQTVLWAEARFEEAGAVFNIANLIKNDPTAGEGE